MYRTEAWQEFLKLVRIPIFAASTIALPLMFYVIFGIAFAGEQAGGVGVTTYMLVTYGAFGVIGAALFGFGVSVAVERGQGWMRLKRVAPMPPLAYFVAKVVMSLAFATIIVLALFALGALLGGVRLGLAQWVAVGLALVAGALPFSAMGLAFGYLVGPNSAPARAQPRLAADGVRVRAVDPDRPASPSWCSRSLRSCRRTTSSSSPWARSEPPRAAHLPRTSGRCWRSPWCSCLWQPGVSGATRDAPTDETRAAVNQRITRYAPYLWLVYLSRWSSSRRSTRTPPP